MNKDECKTPAGERGVVEVLRSRFLGFSIEDFDVVDPAAILRGVVRTSKRTSLIVESPAAFGKKSPLAHAELELLLEISSDVWETLDAASSRLDCDPRQLEALVAKGALLSSGTEEEHRAWRDCETSLRESCWSRTAAMLHFTEGAAFQDSGASTLRATSDPIAQRKAYEGYIERHGDPPPAFFAVPSTASVACSAQPQESELESLLERRATARTFQTDRLLPKHQLASLLESTFGCRGVSEMASGVHVLQRSSPSGGSMHSVEPFVLASRVEGVEPGVYHYDAASSALRLVRAMDDGTDPVADVATRLCAGQAWGGDAHALVFLVARFKRAFWKYPDRGRAYSVILMDAGHLSQTFYLGATKRGLGVFFSGALDTFLVDRLLKLPSGEQSTMGVLGVGFAAEPDPLKLQRVGKESAIDRDRAESS